MKKLILPCLIILLSLYLDAAFMASPVLSRIYLTPGLALCIWLLTEQLRKDWQRVEAIVSISLTYGLITNVNIGLVATCIGLVYALDLILSLLPSKRISESDIIQILGFFNLFTLGLLVINNLSINIAEVALVTILNTLIAWLMLQLLKLSLRASSYA